LSYHADGNVFFTINGETKKIATFRPLKGFTGVHQIGAFAFSSDLSRLRTPIYKMKRLHAATYIDVRQFIKEKCDIGCNVFLLEPNRFDLLNSFKKMPITEIHIFTQFKPWILIIVYGIKTDRYDY